MSYKLASFKLASFKLDMLLALVLSNANLKLENLPTCNSL